MPLLELVSLRVRVLDLYEGWYERWDESSPKGLAVADAGAGASAIGH